MINEQSIENIITNDIIYAALLLINLKWKLSEKEDTIFREWITQGFEPETAEWYEFCDNVNTTIPSEGFQVLVYDNGFCGSSNSELDGSININQKLL